MDVQKIATESVNGRRVDPLRNQTRIHLEVATASANGCSVEGHKIPPAEPRVLRDDEERHPWETHRLVPQPTVIEVYSDRLEAVLGRTRTKSHEAILAAATDQALHLTREWIREHKAGHDARPNPQDRAKWVYINCNHRPEHHLVAFGLRDGLPPLTCCKVVHPKDPAKKCDAFDFAAPNAERGYGLSDEDFQKKYKSRKDEWLHAAPMTPENAQTASTMQLAAILTEAIRAGRESDAKK